MTKYFDVDNLNVDILLLDILDLDKKRSAIIADYVEKWALF
jgi:hypothetical protein